MVSCPNCKGTDFKNGICTYCGCEVRESHHEPPGLDFLDVTKQLPDGFEAPLVPQSIDFWSKFKKVMKVVIVTTLAVIIAYFSIISGIAIYGAVLASVGSTWALVVSILSGCFIAFCLAGLPRIICTCDIENLVDCLRLILFAIVAISDSKD